MIGAGVFAQWDREQARDDWLEQPGRESRIEKSVLDKIRGPCLQTSMR